MDTRTGIVILDDHPIVRKGLRGVIEEEPDLAIIGEASNGEEGLRLIRNLQPQIAIVDLHMPKKDGFAVAEELRRAGVKTGLIFLTFHDDPDLLNRALDVGGLAYILKESALAEIVSGVRSVLEGRPFVSPSMTAALLHRRTMAKAEDDAPLSYLKQLTPSERRILNMIAAGKATKEIANQLRIHPRTVESHRAGICQKLMLSGTNALLRFALEHKAHLLS